MDILISNEIEDTINNFRNLIEEMKDDLSPEEYNSLMGMIDNLHDEFIRNFVSY